MRKLLVGGLALLAAALVVNAEDTKVSSYKSTIDDQMNKASEVGYERKLRDNAPMMSEKDRRNEQEKWDKLTSSERREIQDKRMKARDEGVQHIEKKLRDLDDDARKLQDKKADSDSADKDAKYNEKLEKIQRQRGRLMEMKARLERSEWGQNVDLESAPSVKEETETPARRR